MSSISDLERYMLTLINADRATLGLAPLQLELNLNLSAERQSVWMPETDTFTHAGMDGTEPTDRMREAGFDFYGHWQSAESIAVQSIRAPQAMKTMWRICTLP